MVDSIWTFPEVGMPEEGWVYEVKPSGKVEYHDVGWFIQIYHEFEGLRTMDEVKDHLEFDDVAEEYAKRYWSGSDFGQGAWEYLTPTGVIIKNLGRMEDLMKGELDEMRKRAGIVV